MVHVFFFLHKYYLLETILFEPFSDNKRGHFCHQIFWISICHIAKNWFFLLDVILIGFHVIFAKETQYTSPIYKFQRSFDSCGFDLSRFPFLVSFTWALCLFYNKKHVDVTFWNIILYFLPQKNGVYILLYFHGHEYCFFYLSHFIYKNIIIKDE